MTPPIRITFHGSVIALALSTVGCPQENVTDPKPPPTGSGTAVVNPTASASAPAAPEIKTLYVHETLVDCEGEAPMKCMQVRSAPDEEWIWFYQQIEGFTYEEHHAYELRVEVSKVGDPPADGSSLRYKLIEVISKKSVP